MPAEALAKLSVVSAGPPALLTLALIRRHYVPAGERTLHRWISSGQFPRADIALGGKVRWRRNELVAWMDAGCPSRNWFTASRGVFLFQFI